MTKKDEKREEEKKVSLGANFYKEKGFVKPVTVYLKPDEYERLRRLAFQRKGSLHETLRFIVAEKLGKG